MSLKAFHLIFVAASILLGVVVGGWGIHQYQSKGDVELLILGIIFLVMGIGLVLYGKRMLKKTKDSCLINTTGLTIKDGFLKIKKIMDKKLKEKYERNL